MNQTVAPPSAPPQPMAQAIEMLDLMMRLADLLTNETELVRAGHVRDIAALQREKLRLSLLYRDRIKQLDAGGAKIVALPPPLRAQIVAASSRLAEVAALNERTLRVGRAATRTLLDMIVASVKSRLKPPTRYNMRRQTTGYAQAPALAIDRRL